MSIFEICWAIICVAVTVLVVAFVIIVILAMIAGVRGWEK